MDRTRTQIDYICGFACGICTMRHSLRAYGTAWHGMQLTSQIRWRFHRPSLLHNNGNASFGKRKSRKELADCVHRQLCFFSLFCVVQLFHITAQHSTLCIMYASQPASQPYLGAQLSRRCRMCSYTRVLWSARLPRPPPPLT